MRISDWSSDVCSSDLGSRSRLLQDPLEQQRCVGRRVEPAVRYLGDLLQRAAAQPGHEAREIDRLMPGNRIMMDDAERILVLPHMDAGKQPPGAADGVEGIAAHSAEPDEESGRAWCRERGSQDG